MKLKKKISDIHNTDDFCMKLLEESKRLYEKSQKESSEDGSDAYLHSSLLIGFAALEAHVNSVANDFSDRSELTILDKSIFFEKDYKLEKGQYILTDNLKMYRLEERYEFIYRKYSRKPVDTNSNWWSLLKQGIDLRNKLTHPKTTVIIRPKEVENTLNAIIDAIDNLYKAVYRRPYPLKKRGLLSNMDF